MHLNYTQIYITTRYVHGYNEGGTEEPPVSQYRQRSPLYWKNTPVSRMMALGQLSDGRLTKSCPKKSENFVQDIDI